MSTICPLYIGDGVLGLPAVHFCIYLSTSALLDLLIPHFYKFPSIRLFFHYDTSCPAHGLGSATYFDISTYHFSFAFLATYFSFVQTCFNSHALLA